MRAVLAGTALLLFTAPAAAQRTERFTLSGGEAEVYNLAGEVTVVAESGPSVVVEVTRGGSDAGELRIDPSGSRVRVIYPGDRIVYGRLGRMGRSTVTVSADGTFGEGGGVMRGRRRRVEIAGSGSGTRAWADLRVRVPAGRAVAVHQAVGEVTVTNVNGRLRVETASGAVEASGTRGSLSVEAGSGAIAIRNAQGDVTAETGSGSIVLEDIRGTARVVAETGSGSITGSGVSAQTVSLETGSGSIRVTGVGARDLTAETGSGSINLTLTRDAQTVSLDTGSGGVTLGVPASFGAQLTVDTGSGGIDVDVPVTAVRRGRTEFRGRIGDGQGTVEIDTGSGSVRIIRS